MVSLKLHLQVDEERLTLNIQSDPEQLLGDLFAKVAAKRGLLLRPEFYKFREYDPNSDFEETVQPVSVTWVGR